MNKDRNSGEDALVPFHEGVEVYPLKCFLWRRDSTSEWVLEISGAINDCSFVARHAEPLTTKPEDAVGLPSLYTRTTLPDGIEGLLQRLERKNCDHWPDEQCCACLVNPDGPEAASTIRSLQDQLEALRRGEAA